MDLPSQQRSSNVSEGAVSDTRRRSSALISFFLHLDLSPILNSDFFFPSFRSFILHTDLDFSPILNSDFFFPSF